MYVEGSSKKTIKIHAIKKKDSCYQCHTLHELQSIIFGTRIESTKIVKKVKIFLELINFTSLA
jgi:hypothetical protein